MLSQNFSLFSPVLLTPLINIHSQISPRIFEKIWNGLNGSGARGTLIYEKNLKVKISCQTPFKGKSLDQTLTTSNTSESPKPPVLFFLNACCIQNFCWNITFKTSWWGCKFCFTIYSVIYYNIHTFCRYARHVLSTYVKDFSSFLY